MCEAQQHVALGRPPMCWDGTLMPARMATCITCYPIMYNMLSFFSHINSLADKSFRSQPCESPTKDSKPLAFRTDQFWGFGHGSWSLERDLTTRAERPFYYFPLQLARIATAFVPVLSLSSVLVFRPLKYQPDRAPAADDRRQTIVHCRD